MAIDAQSVRDKVFEFLGLETNQYDEDWKIYTIKKLIIEAVRLAFWSYIWFIETNLFFIIIVRRDFEYISDNFIFMYLIVAMITTILLNPSSKDVRRRMW